MQQFTATIRLPASADEVFRWHERDGAFERLNPPWQYVRVIEHTGGIKDGARVHLRIGLAGPVRVDWILSHRDYIEGRQFRDEQVRGPFAHWSHLHLMEPGTDSVNESMLTDSIEYKLPLGPIGRVFGSGHSKTTLDQLFTYRHRITYDDLALHAKFAGKPRLRVAVSGATGLIGSALAPLLTTGGHEVVRLVRREATNDHEVQWDAESGIAPGDLDKLRNVDVIVHLAGENVGSGRWTPERMQRIRDSRVVGTRSLVQSLLDADIVPPVFIGTSAIGYYGERGDVTVDESAGFGSTFLAGVCRDWESATSPLAERDVRVVHPRVGIVLTPAGGVLAKMLLPFKLGGGGVVGSGRQWYSWIGLDDCISAMYHCIMDDSMHGPVNLASPEPVTNREFTKALGRALRRPTILPMPAGLARAAFSPKMAEETLLSSTRVTPRRLMESDYTYRTPTLDEALRHGLGLRRTTN